MIIRAMLISSSLNNLIEPQGQKNDHSNGTRTGLEVAAACYDGGEVLRISGRQLVYDAAARGHVIPSHCADCECDGCRYRCFCRLARA